MWLREDGCLKLPATVETACRTAARKVPELEGFHFQHLWHTYTTNLLSNRAQSKDVQEPLGHSDISTTMNVYAHAIMKAKRESAKLLGKVVGMNQEQKLNKKTFPCNLPMRAKTREKDIDFEAGIVQSLEK